MGYKCFWCSQYAWYTRWTWIIEEKIVMINEIIADLIYGGIILVFPVSALIMQKIEDKRNN